MVCVCKEDSQSKDDELNVERSNMKLPEFHSLGTAQWSWAEIWTAADRNVSLMPSSTEFCNVLWSEELSNGIFERIWLIILKHALLSVQANAPSVQ